MAVTINASTSAGLISTADTSGILQLQTANTTALTINASQNVGIGVTPSAWRSSFNVTYGERVLELTYSALVTQAGPSTILANNVYFNSSNQWIYKNAVANTNAGLYTIGSNGVHSWSVAPTGASGAVATFTQAMTLDASGNLGVGTTSPTTLVDLVRSSLTGSDVSMPNIFVRNTSATQGNGGSTFNQAVISASAGNGTVFGGIRAAYDSAGSYGTGMQLYVNSTNPLQFYTNNAERARIDSSGRFMVGKTSSSDSVAGLQLQNFSGTAGTISCIKTASGQATAWGNYHSGTYVGGMEYTNTATSFPTSSDSRLKKDIVDSSSASAKIDQIRIVSHGWRHDDASVEFGVIAQELYSIAPQAVTKGDDGETIEKVWGVDYSKLVPMLVKAHQEQQALIQSLKARLDAANL